MGSTEIVEINLVVKYFLFGYNVCFWIFGVCLFVIGVYSFTDKAFINNIAKVSSAPVDPVTLVILVAILIVGISFLGCMGALRESAILLHYFSICIAFTIVVGLILSILGGFYGGWFNNRFVEFANSTIQFYRQDDDLQSLIDFTQSYFRCCGSYGPDDWNSNVYFKCSSFVEYNGVSYKPLEACGVPYSCCTTDGTGRDDTNTQCGFGIRDPSIDAFDRAEVIYISGCVQAVRDWINTHLKTVKAILITVALSQVIILLMAQDLLIAIRTIASEDPPEMTRLTDVSKSTSDKESTSHAYEV